MGADSLSQLGALPMVHAAYLFLVAWAAFAAGYVVRSLESRLGE